MDREKFNKFLSLQSEYWKVDEEIKSVILDFAKRLEIFRYPVRQTKYGYLSNIIAPDNFFIGSNEISIDWEEYCYGESERYYFTFPTSYLFMAEPDWIESEVNEIKRRQEKIALKKKEDDKKRKEEQRKRDEETFEILKKRLGK